MTVTHGAARVGPVEAVQPREAEVGKRLAEALVVHEAAHPLVQAHAAVGVTVLAGRDTRGDLHAKL